MSELVAAATPTVTGRLAEKSDDSIVLEVLSSEYRLHLKLTQPLTAAVGDRITGTIHVQALRVDVVDAGGRYIEPVYGRPRRVQGRITGGDLHGNTIFVKAGPASVVAKLMSPQKTAEFAVGQMASFDVQSGATFESA